MARYSCPVFDLGGLVANADMNSNQYKFMRCGSTAGEFKLGNGACNPVPLGVLQDDPRQGDAGAIRIYGTTKLYVDGDTDIAFADFIIAGSVGQGKVNASASSIHNAIALEAATAAGSGNLIEVLLTPWACTAADNTP